MPVEARRKPRLHISLRADIVEALERSAKESGMSVSRVIENLLGFQMELENIKEKEHALMELQRSFRRRKQS
jgi:FtsZ-binding cell division protein ZapB